MHSSWRSVEPSLSGRSETRSASRWIVTQSPRRSGSITTFHTCSGGASISISAVTLLMPRTLSGREWFAFLPLPQSPLDGGLEGVQPDAQEGRRGVVAGEEVVAQALHQRPDEL